MFGIWINEMDGCWDGGMDECGMWDVGFGDFSFMALCSLVVCWIYFEDGMK